MKWIFSVNIKWNTQLTVKVIFEQKIKIVAILKNDKLEDDKENVLSYWQSLNETKKIIISK